ncbi:hypothetical protein ISG08_20180 [Burkholderia pseudomallei]|nr:conserved hypothetical protein [Burkholderia pseudomallei Pakistan 9]KGS43810.1 hAD-superfamily hydrolase [Burkholderia pseudomallei MSHR5613]KKI73278.1 hypothetical protein VU09_24095 [Burkholderia pseudomallei]MBF3695758.1 hypothetical protein [Burkholderia pseudomallei]MBF3758312.1 hypothetical protein [Burkholderia pseudomallei]
MSATRFATKNIVGHGLRHTRHSAHRNGARVARRRTEPDRKIPIAKCIGAPNRRRGAIDRKAFRIDVAPCDDRPFYRTFGAMLTSRTAIRFTSRESAQERAIGADNAHGARRLRSFSARGGQVAVGK